MHTNKVIANKIKIVFRKSKTEAKLLSNNINMYFYHTDNKPLSRKEWLESLEVF